VTRPLTTLDSRSIGLLDEALRFGAPLDLRLEGPLPAPLEAPEVAPLFRSARSTDPSTDAALQRWSAPAARWAPGPAVTAVLPASRGRPIGIGALRGQDVPVRVLVLANGRHGPQRVDGAEVRVVPWRGHGTTRQAAVAEVETPYVLFTVDDAVVLGAGCIRRMIETLESTGADAVVARQVPWPSADRVTRERLRAWTPARPGPRDVSQVDHVCALYRTRTLRDSPLPDVPIAEDLAWSRSRRVVLAPDAPVLHSHARRVRALWARERATHAQRRRLGMSSTVPSLGGALVQALGAVRHGPREVPRHLAELLGQWWGGRA